MAGVFSKKGTKNLYCCYPGPDGRKVYRSTGTPDRKEAKRRAVLWEMEAEEELQASSEIQRELLQCVRQAGDLASRRQLTLDRGRELVSRMIETVTGERMRFYTVREWFKTWLADRAVRVKPGTLSRYSGSCAKFLAHLGERADQALEFVTEDDVRSFRPSP